MLAGKSECLIMDEPTCSQDPKAEAEFLSNLKNIIQEKACILISHRLSIARHTDRIIVLNNGQIIEDGNHDF
jgi:ATP-binding cassette subfamily B protein